MADAQIELHLEVGSQEIKAVELLAGHCGLSRGQLKRTMRNGALWLERKGHVQRLRRADRRLVPGDVLHLYYDARIQQQTPFEAQLIRDEGDYSVWFKPPGMYSQGSKWGDHCSLPRWAEQRLQPQRSAFIVHRLDRAASGLMLLAHGKGAAARLSELFRQRLLAKQYRVKVQGEFPQGDIQMDAPLDGRQALSRASCLSYAAVSNQSLLQVDIHTGRKHQIRRHLSGLGFPVVGDRLYGGGDGGDLQLQAVRLAFTCPMTGQPRDYRLPNSLLISL
ncbi:pseudouridine synthase family protein [Thiolapillus brandeum]|uniref:RNA pseudouridylate synthase n=1 Tax=Thiolapillus brandeum TaxID=1076588 RepID=A0A7U6GGQ7_9GAMM|nr:pseudouridine synthase [Thiolapillus brandeum]BAO43316.1 RNA pseudouridylate synthase [Thiolapillus brandeum]